MKTVWLDVMGIQSYPVFDVHKGAGGRDRRYTYPDEAPTLPARLRAQPLDGRRRTACSSAPPATCTRAACGPT